eukprot:4805540-Pyramimonas_sp.AAC.1
MSPAAEGARGSLLALPFGPRRFPFGPAEAAPSLTRPGARAQIRPRDENNHPPQPRQAEERHPRRHGDSARGARERARGL